MNHGPVIPLGTHHRLKFIGHERIWTGPMAIGASPKTLWHTAEMTDLIDTVDALIRKRAEPHFVLDIAKGRCIQLISMDEYARALEHPTGTPETNLAGCIQIEICGYAKDSTKWTEREYHHIAALALLIEYHTKCARISDKDFVGEGRAVHVRPENWLHAHGHFGHEHAPSQPDGHWDPGAMRIHNVFHLMNEIQNNHHHNGG